MGDSPAPVGRCPATPAPRSSPASPFPRPVLADVQPGQCDPHRSPRQRKTTLGRALARALGAAFVDLDEVLGERAGRPAEDVLAQEGEPAFRQREVEVLQWAAGLSGSVVATGGGAVLHGESFARLGATGVVVHLEQDLDTLVARQRAEPRTPLTSLGLEAEVGRLWEERGPLYRSAAQITIPATLRDPILVALRALDGPARPDPE